MAILVITVGALASLISLAIGIHSYGKLVREHHLDLLARWFRDDKGSFELFMYQQSIRVTKAEMAKQKNES